MIRLPFTSESDWLAEKLNKVSASESSVVIGENPWGSIDELYDIKVGLREARDISEEPQIIRGNMGEPIVRSEFALLNEDYRMDYHQYDILCHEKYPFISATLDGELTYIGSPRILTSPTGYAKMLKAGDLGVWECKVTVARSNADLDKWDGQIPSYYLSQIITQLFVTGWPFAILTAKIIHLSGEYKDNEWISDDFPTIHTRNYIFFASDPVIRESMLYVIRKDIEFYNCVQQRIRPALIIKSL